MAIGTENIENNQIEENKTKLKQLQKKEIILKELLAPELIGGIRLRVGFKDIDGSIKKKLSILRQELLLEGE